MPEAGPAGLEEVKSLLQISDNVDDADLTLVVAAVNDVVRGLPIAVAVAADATTWPARISRGANMLAVRLFRRRNSPAGVETFGDLGPVYVQRNDPDIAMLLQIGAYTKPAVG